MKLLFYIALFNFFFTETAPLQNAQLNETQLHKTKHYKPRISKLETFHTENKQRTVLFSSKKIVESPNWGHDGSYMIYNSNGNMYRLDLKTKRSYQIDTGFAKQCNANHGITPDGTGIIFSNNDPERKTGPTIGGGSRIYYVPIKGGVPRLLTEKAASKWHGISPDGKVIAYSGSRNGEFDIYIMHIKGGAELRLTSARGLDDGPDYSPDGKYIYFNSYRTGSMEIWRIDANGSNPIQITDDTFSNWFPHPSPDGKYLLIMSYLNEQGYVHPAEKDVMLRLLNLDTGKIEILFRITGGQGTVNSPSWAPNSKEFAFVSYEN